MSAVYMGRRQKYAARRCDCGRHASRKECRRHQELVLLERAGEIRALREQVTFELAPAVVLNGRKKPALRYVADWTYEECRADQPAPCVGYAQCPTGDGECVCWCPVIEDTTGVMTPVKRIKLHLLALKGLEVRIT